MKPAMRNARIRDYLRSFYDGWKLQKEFAAVEKYLMFVGYPRSGHSLVGALLNAHPNMMVSHELDALTFVRYPASRSQLFALILRKNEQFVLGGYNWAGYNYEVRGQHQDRCESIRVIGDKKGGASSLQVEARPELIQRLRRKVGVPLRVIHITRNPFDNVATISARHGRDLLSAVKWYRRHCRGVQAAIEATQPDEFITIKYEAFIADPKEKLSALCSFVGLTTSEEYLEACSALVFPSPSRTRDKVQWSVEERSAINEVISEFPFLSGYSEQSPKVTAAD
jgi:hypothetical protein